MPTRRTRHSAKTYGSLGKGLSAGRALRAVAGGVSEPADYSLVVEPLEQLSNRGVQLGKAVEPSMAQARQKPSLDGENRGLDLGFVTRPVWPRRRIGRKLV
jgi:hypothetical protein